MTSPFDYANAVSHSKRDLIAEAGEEGYDPFLVNRALSYHVDAIMHANEMNRLPMLPPRAQFKYYLNTLRPRKRFSKWAKPESDLLPLVCEYFRCNHKIGKQLLRTMTEEQIEEMKARMERGG